MDDSGVRGLRHGKDLLPVPSMRRVRRRTSASLVSMRRRRRGVVVELVVELGADLRHGAHP